MMPAVTKYLLPQELIMTDAHFDAKAFSESYRSAFAPLLKAQQEGVKTFDRFGRYQHAVAGDYLDWSVAQAKLVLDAKTPAELFAKQMQLTTSLSERMRARAQEFLKLATEAQSGMTDMVTEMTSKVASETKRRAA
jgi:phasin family protein